ncbi:hypothetical protein T02_2672 [Trichinella nativa]|uniref:Uncharacterized protein n=4 Tax=Trichinella TaxID=6333 RepID=A0A0V1KVV6_9BILA|nr:hypothetical protein T05_5947 [Trichinella murrelli]KRX74476.1 hypothetical protein T06_1969 [Trichinella sp. T6]KRY12634.1 hypothetical protein T12_9034 [Trichinella patagoniensis]KRY54571.1 hypothetical protein T03_8987 [Trichinella britovi]KRZ51487.1 hypothetical protein T02_2672 [Trichinella nativa]KRZ84158.1 hypothetical protein T08_6003 [Trichinella sp. T8]
MRLILNSVHCGQAIFSETHSITHKHKLKAHFRRFKQQAVTSKIQQTAMQAGQRLTVRLLLICQLNVNCLSLPSTSTCTFLLQSSERFV